MSTTYQFNVPTNSMTFYTKSSARLYVGGSITANTDSNTLTEGLTLALDATLLGAKVTQNTPLMLALTGSLSFSAEYSAGKFKYTGVGSEQSTAETDDALAATKSALAEVNQSKADLKRDVTSLALRAVQFEQDRISVTS